MRESAYLPVALDGEAQAPFLEINESLFVEKWKIC